MISVGAAWIEESIPEELLGLERPEATSGESGSQIIGPWGNILAEAPTSEEEAIIIAAVSLEALTEAKLSCDIAGHYARPDVLQLHVNHRPLVPVVETDPVDRATVPGEFQVVGPNLADDQQDEGERAG